MADSVPARCRTVWPSERNGVRHAWNAVRLAPGTGRLDASLIHRPPFAPLPKGSEAVAQPRLAMRKIKDVLRLHLVGGVTSRRQLARTVGCGKSAVSECLR